MTAPDIVLALLGVCLLAGLCFAIWRISKAGVEVRLFGGIKVKVGKL